MITVINLYSKEVSEQTKIKCDWELYYLINSCIYLALNARDLKVDKNELMGHYLAECSRFLHTERSKKDGDYAVSQLNLRIQAYNLPKISGELNSFIGKRSILLSNVCAIIKTGDLNVADDIVIEYINNQNSINNEYLQGFPTTGYIAEEIYMNIHIAIDKALNQLSDVKII